MNCQKRGPTSPFRPYFATVALALEFFEAFIALCALLLTAAVSFLNIKSNSSGYPGHCLLDFLHCVQQGRTSSHYSILVVVIPPKNATYLDTTSLAILATPTWFPLVQRQYIKLMFNSMCLG
jgi:hypothetical protein